jgi:hypothetical protein
MELRGNAYCLIDEATRAVLRVSSEPLAAPDGCFVCSVRGDQLPLEVQALSKTPVPFDIEAVFIGAGRAVYLADDDEMVRVEVREMASSAAEDRYAELLARSLETLEPSGLVEAALVGLVETLEPSGLVEAALVGLVRHVGAETVARAALGTGTPAPKPKAEEKPKPATRKTRKKVK